MSAVKRGTKTRAGNVAPADGRGGNRYRALLKQRNVPLERRGGRWDPECLAGCRRLSGCESQK
jgi:hypothetical protein